MFALFGKGSGGFLLCLFALLYVYMLVLLNFVMVPGVLALSVFLALCLAIDYALLCVAKDMGVSCFVCFIAMLPIFMLCRFAEDMGVSASFITPVLQG